MPPLSPGAGSVNGAESSNDAASTSGDEVGVSERHRQYHATTPSSASNSQPPFTVGCDMPAQFDLSKPLNATTLNTFRYSAWFTVYSYKSTACLWGCRRSQADAILNYATALQYTSGRHGWGARGSYESNYREHCRYTDDVTTLTTVNTAATLMTSRL
jgi:hypothetical protein